MSSYRGMSRGLCAVAGSFGAGLGHAILLVRLVPRRDEATSLRAWLLDELLPSLPSRPGLGSAHLLEGAATPAMTREQSLRGADAPVDWAVLVVGYSEAALAELAQQALGVASLEEHGAASTVSGLYRLDYSMTARDLAT